MGNVFNMRTVASLIRFILDNKNMKNKILFTLLAYAGIALVAGIYLLVIVSTYLFIKDLIA